jgi:thymidylate synthase (FAD)
MSDLTKEFKYPEAPLVDVMEGASRIEYKIGEHGLVALVDVMPRLVPQGKTADYAICQAARVSYGEGTKQVSEDRGLIRYLMRHRHTTPSEMIEWKFHCVMPIFVARQWIRHRTANVNEYSARYSVVKDRFFMPENDGLRSQSGSNKQSSEGSIGEMDAEEFARRLEETCKTSYETYEKALAGGMGRELARMILPVNVFTEWYWKIDLHNLFHFLSLRMDKHAQKEIRDYADAMFALVQPIVPVACEAFLDYRLHAMQLTRLEIEAIRTGSPLSTDNKREQQEWEEKKERLKLGPPSPNTLV